MLVDAVHQRAVKIEQKAQGARIMGFCHSTSLSLEAILQGLPPACCAYCHGPYSSNFACMVMVVLSKREIGQPAFAPSVALSQAAWSAFGTLPLTSSKIFVTVQPASSFSKVTVAVVSSFSGTKPAFPNCPDKAMVKQPACAAAISSSGLVPLP